MMDIDDRVDLVPGSERHLVELGNEPTLPAAEPLGRLVAVSGSQVTVRFATDQALPCEHNAERHGRRPARDQNRKLVGDRSALRGIAQ